MNTMTIRATGTVFAKASCLLPCLPLELMGPVGDVRRIYEAGVTHITGRGPSLGSVFFGEIVPAAAGSDMTDPAIAEGLGNALVLDRLVIIRGLVRWRHGMRAGVTAD